MKKYYFILILTGLICSCNNEVKKVTKKEKIKSVLSDTLNMVSVTTLKKQKFNHELISNGKVTACMMADLRFENNEVIARIWVKNGDHVHKGQKLAELDKFRLYNQLSQAKNILDKTELELRDVLIGQGYLANDFIKVPKETMKLAKVKSGYDQSKLQYDIAKYNAEHATLTAPFDGVIANLFSKPYNLASTSDVFCTVVGVQRMEVDFTILERELPLIKIGDEVVIKPYSNAAITHKGRISEINPLVDAKGVVKVKAHVNGSRKLFCGMNVRISVYCSLIDQLVIPKSAVVIRSGKQIVFTLKNGKVAQRNYIQTALENTDSYSIVNGLAEGDTVIFTGNINLAHEAPVEVIN